MTKLWRLALGLILAVSFAPTTLSTTLSRQSEPPAPAELAREILEDADYQSELPNEITDAPRSLPRGLGELATLLLFIGGAVALILLLFWTSNEFLFGRVGSTKTDAGHTISEPGSGDPRLLADPERLAGEGRYDEAVHMLLLIAIRHLSGKLPAPPSPSSTSRELLRALPLSNDRRQALGFLVRTVELSLFGGGNVGADDYANCRTQFQVLVTEAAA